MAFQSPRGRAQRLLPYLEDLADFLMTKVIFPLLLLLGFLLFLLYWAFSPSRDRLTGYHTLLFGSKSAKAADYAPSLLDWIFDKLSTAVGYVVGILVAISVLIPIRLGLALASVIAYVVRATLSFLVRLVTQLVPRLAYLARRDKGQDFHKSGNPLP